MKATTATLASLAVLAFASSLASEVVAQGPEFETWDRTPLPPPPEAAPKPEIVEEVKLVQFSNWELLGHSIATYYGSELDGFLGRRHAASWHGKTPQDFSEVVTGCCEPGVALSTCWGIEFGEEILVVWEDKGLAARVVRVDAKPGRGVDLYEWVYLKLSPSDIGPLEVAVYARKEPTPTVTSTSFWDSPVREYAPPTRVPKKESILDAEEDHSFRSPLYLLPGVEGGIPEYPLH